MTRLHVPLALVVLLSSACGPDEDRPRHDVVPSAPSPLANGDFRCPPWTHFPGASTAGVESELQWEEFRRHLRLMDEVEPGHVLRRVGDLVNNAWAGGAPLCAESLRQAGRILFEHEFRPAEGLGRADVPEPAVPTRFRRVHQGARGGPDAISCVSCHWRGGNAGAGALVDQSFIHGDGNAPASADMRNPPSLAGVGVALRVAQEMTEDLHAQRDAALAEASRRRAAVNVALVSKGVVFGVLEARPDGVLDTALLEGVDPDLVVKPLGWKGAFQDLREFIPESLHVHFGIQSADLLADPASGPARVGSGPADDPDGDGVRDELSAGHVTAMAYFLASLPAPAPVAPERVMITEPPAPGLLPPTQLDYSDDWARGWRVFGATGCAGCHVPAMVLRSPVLRLRGGPSGQDVELDLSNVGPGSLVYDPLAGGWPVWPFSDFRRHDLGAGNAALHPEAEKGIPATHYLTRRLWDVANTPPYFYDGRSPTMEDAIQRHGGEASPSVQAFQQLGDRDRADLRVFLMGLRRAREVVVP